MQKICPRILCLLPILLFPLASEGQQIKSIKVAVSNPGVSARSAADVTIPIDALRQIAPDFKPGSLIVTASDAGTLEQDAAVLETEELPHAVGALQSGKRQAEFSHGGVTRDLQLQLENIIAPRQWIFTHTHQGFGADTTGVGRLRILIGLRCHSRSEAA
jgi:hypothetical protein